MRFASTDHRDIWPLWSFRGFPATGTGRLHQKEKRLMIHEDAADRERERDGLFAGSDPFDISRRWLKAATGAEPNDPNAMALATVGADGLPNARMVLLKDIEDAGFVFYTNRTSAKGTELGGTARAAAVLHWKSLRQQLRFRGPVEAVDGPTSDAYFDTRHPQSRAAAVASKQSQPLASRQAMMDETAAVTEMSDGAPQRPEHWGGYRIRPVEIEFWADGEHRIHDRFRWTRDTPEAQGWRVQRLYP